MKRDTALKIYFCGILAVMLTNVASFSLGLVGIRGIAFYHMQSVLLAGCLLHGALLLLAGKFQTFGPPPLLRLILCSLGYTVLSCVLLLRFHDVVPAYVGMMLYTYIVYPLSAVALVSCAPAEDRHHSSHATLPRWLAWAALIILLFGWVQFALRDTLIHVTNSENISKLVEPNLLGTFRPPSIFESSFQYGLFAVLVMSISGAYVFHGSRRVAAGLLASVALLSVALSQTRNVFLCAVAAIISLFLVRISAAVPRALKALRLMPLAYLFGSMVLVWVAVSQFLNSDLARTDDLTDASSALSRVSGWFTAFQDLVLPGNIFDALFGYGITQAGHASDFRSIYPSRGDGLFIDNTFLNLFLFQGLIGLILFLSLYWAIWRRLLQTVRISHDPFATGLTCFFSAFLAAGVLNILNGQWWGIMLALTLVVLSGPLKQEVRPCAP